MRHCLTRLGSRRLRNGFAAAIAAFPDHPLRLVVPFPAGGAGGTLGAEAVANAPKDGYALLFATMGTLAIDPSLYLRLRYDPLRGFAPISPTDLAPRVLVVASGLPARSVPDLVALSRREPGTLTCGSAGNGSSGHLSDALSTRSAGSAPRLDDVLAGRVDMTFDSRAIHEEHPKSGRVRVSGSTGARRMPSLPQMPTIAESVCRSAGPT